MPTYLLELGTEELPAEQVTEAQEKLKTLVADALKSASVEFEDVATMGTPRRLACLVKGLAPVQATIKKKIKGPKVQSSFDASGNALPAAVGFATKHGLTVDKLVREEAGGAEHLFADVTIEGRPSGEVLSDVVPECIMKLSGERLMRWGNGEMRFSRPIRWLVSLLDTNELPITLENVTSGRSSYGNRVLAPGKVEITHPDKYVDAMRAARVLVCPQERQSLIEEQVKAAAKKLNGRPRQLSGGLLQEVLNILEWPHAVIGEFEKEYLDLPDTLIETIMVHHQRYFPVEAETGNGEGRLLPNFITVANNDRPEAEKYIKQGNERVIRARLADGRFFYFDDQKTKLTDRQHQLGLLTFQEGLGSYLKKTERLLKAGRALSQANKLDAKHSVCLERTLELAKLDLVTNLVRELPELQGHVGSWYAAKEGEPPEVAAAISSHYKPRSSDDDIPADTVGRLCAVVDKLDNLVGLFGLGRRPSGSSDPYGLRRNAQGLVDIAMDGLAEIPVNLIELSKTLMDEIKILLERKRGFDAQKALDDLYEFLVTRVRGKLQEKGIRREVIDAVCTCSSVLTNLPDVLVRARCFEKLIERDAKMSLLRAGVRVGNILSPDAGNKVDEAILELAEEKALWKAVQENVIKKWSGDLAAPKTEAEYMQIMDLLEPIAGDLDKFFVGVMVNDPDAKKKANRHALLKTVHVYFARLGEFPKLQPILPGGTN